MDDTTTPSALTIAKIQALTQAWQDHFPADLETARKWKPIILRRHLGPTVLCAARTRLRSTWAAYIKGMPENAEEQDEAFVTDEQRELADVLATGTKLSEPIARAVFPEFKGVPYAG